MCARVRVLPGEIDVGICSQSRSLRHFNQNTNLYIENKAWALSFIWHWVFLVCECEFVSKQAVI